jgi:hypothetical protein
VKLVVEAELKIEEIEESDTSNSHLENLELRTRWWQSRLEVDKQRCFLVNSES